MKSNVRCDVESSQDILITELIEMGDYYGEKDLIKRSGKQLCLFMDSGNALRIYDVAVKHELEVCWRCSLAKQVNKYRS